MDKYATFADLAAHERAGVDYRVAALARGARALIAAPHGGSIEPGTSEIAIAIAGTNLSLYLFEGLQGRRQGELHITSSRFDEPNFRDLAATADVVVAIHGRRDRLDPETVWAGALED